MSLSSKKFLVVEDYQPNREVMADIFELLEITADYAEDGESALHKISSGNYDLVFLDLQIPVMSGLEVAQKLREQKNNVILIALTANALTTSKQKCLQLGINDYLSKPITFDDIKTVIHKHLC